MSLRKLPISKHVDALEHKLARVLDSCGHTNRERLLDAQLAEHYSRALAALLSVPGTL